MSMAGVIHTTLTKLCSKESPDSLSAIVKQKAPAYSLDPRLVACIIYQESGGDEEAFRFEDEFFDRHYLDYLSTPPRKQRKELAGYVPVFPPSLRSELRARAASWGVMQILGETARVVGFDARYLPSCRKTEINVELGCKFLRRLFDKAATLHPDWTEQRTLTLVLTWWNGSEEYPPLIFEHMRKEKWRAILL